MKAEKKNLLSAVLSVPAAVLPLLPSASCPFCIAAYAGALSALGLGFLVEDRVLTPLIVVFLLVGIASVAWTTRSHKRIAPLVLSIVGGAGIAIGRLILQVPMLVYAGAGMMVLAAVWNLWLKRRRRRSSKSEAGHNRFARTTYQRVEGATHDNQPNHRNLHCRMPALRNGRRGDPTNGLRRLERRGPRPPVRL